MFAVVCWACVSDCVYSLIHSVSLYCACVLSVCEVCVMRECVPGIVKYIVLTPS